MSIKSLGKHLVIELYSCDSQILSDVRKVEDIMVEATKKTKARIIDVVFHTFSPFGISGVVVIAESHLSIHTWPEYGFASIDIFTCGPKTNPWIAYKLLVKRFKAKQSTAMELKRGVMGFPPIKIKKEEG